MDTPLRIKNEQLPLLSNLFNSQTLRQLAYYKKSKYLNQALKLFNINLINKITYESLLSKIYYKMRKNYQNEYIFKNELLLQEFTNKILDDKRFFNEVRIGQSILDFLVTNGKTSAYEIKTKLDRLDRLDRQLNDYIRAFDNVNVVIDPCHLKNINYILNKNYRFKNIGIIIFNKNLKFETIREAKTTQDFLDKNLIFNLLTQTEIKKYTQTDNIVEAQNIFTQYDIEEIQKCILTTFKKRNYSICDIRKIPKCLSIVGIKFQKLPRKYIDNFLNLIKSSIII